MHLNPEFQALFDEWAWKVALWYSLPAIALLFWFALRGIRR